MSPAELEWLSETAAQMGSVLEVGSLHGRSSYAIASGCRGPVVCIDPWDDEQHESLPSFVKNVAGVFSNVRPLQGRSPYIADRFDRSDPADMVFIDGAHAYEAVLADICAWRPLCRRFLCGHDYHQGPDAGFPGVARAVDQVFGGRVFVPDGTSIWTVNLERDRGVEPDLPTGQITWTDEYGRTYTYDLQWT